jgi:hypothetical protein
MKAVPAPDDAGITGSGWKIIGHPRERTAGSLCRRHQRFGAVPSMAVDARQGCAPTEIHIARPFGPRARKIFRLGGVQFDWAHPQLEEGVVRHGVLPNQQMKPSTGQEGI